MVESRNGRRFAVFFFIAAFLVLILGRWLRPVDHLALTVSAPFTAAISGVSNWVGDGFASIVDGPKLRSEVDTLKKENARLLQQTIADAEARHENAILHRMLGFETSHRKYQYLVSRVIGIDVASALAPYIDIDRGTSDGVRDGMTVLDQNGYFVGAVSDVWRNAARVELLLSPSRSVGAYDLRSRAIGLVQGEYSALPQFGLVAASASVQPGDLILTSGECLLYPRGLVIGQVRSVQHSNVAATQTATVQPATDFRNIEIAQVIRNFLPPLPSQLACKQ